MTSTNRVGLITGATGGLGRIVAQQFADLGMNLALVGRNQEKLDSLVAHLNLPPERILPLPMEINSAEVAQAVAEEVIEKFGRADILVHLVGGWIGGKSIPEVSPMEITRMLEQHLWSTFYLLQACSPHMATSGSGRVIVVSSPSATNPPGNNLPYVVGKSSQEALVLTFAKEMLQHGITANILQVRAIDVHREREKDPEGMKKFWSTPEEIAAAILFLCSDKAQGISGARIPLYGISN